MTKQQQKCLKILKKNGELTSEELFKRMKLELRSDSSSFYGTLIDILNYPDDEEFEDKIEVSFLDLEDDPLSDLAEFKLSRVGHNFLSDKKIRSIDKNYNRSMWWIAFAALIVTCIGLLISLNTLGILNLSFLQ